MQAAGHLEQPSRLPWTLGCLVRSGEQSPQEDGKEVNLGFSRTVVLLFVRRGHRSGPLLPGKCVDWLLL